SSPVGIDQGERTGGNRTTEITESTERDHLVAGRVRRACDDAPFSLLLARMRQDLVFHRDLQIFFAPGPRGADRILERRHPAGVSGGRLSAARPASFSSSGERPPGGDPAFLAPRNLGRALSPPRDGQTAGAPSGRHKLYVCPLPLLEWSKLGC